MMTRELEDFVNTLPEEIQEAVRGKRNKGVLRVLDERGIQVPETVLAAVEARTNRLSHEDLMDHMRPFKGKTVDQSLAGVRE